MIWSRESIPVSNIQDGHESSIAGPINAPNRAGLVDLHTVFRKEITLSDTPVRAWLHLFAYTRYRLYVNGQYVGRGPSRFQNQRPEYDTRDIAAFLTHGRNVIAVLVHRDAPTGRIMLHDPGFAALLEWRANGGSTRTIVTDKSWLAKPDLSFGSRTRAWGSIEENIDARKSADWAELAHDASDWTPAMRVGGEGFFPLWTRTTPLQLETVREWRSSTMPLPATLQAPAELSFELDEIIQGYHLFEFDADAGSTLEVLYRLPENTRSGVNSYIAREGEQTYLGGDTFAFNQLTLSLKNGKLRLTRADAFEVRYPFETAGRFESSDPFLNHVWAICARSLEVLSEDAYVDCADRERVEWTDNSPPAFDCTRVMMAGVKPDGSAAWSDPRLLKALLRRIAFTQQPDGQIKAHSCSERWDIHAIMEDRSCDWVILLSQYLESTGDQAFVRELWPVMTRLLQWFLAHRTNRGLVLAREWEVWDNPLRYQVCEGAGLNALTYRALRAASVLGQRIGEVTDASTFSIAADQLAGAFNELLWNSDEGTYYGALFGPDSKMNPQLNGEMFTGPIINGHYRPTLQAALLALDSRIVPSERLAPLNKWVLSHQDEATGPMSHNLLFNALYALDDQQQDAGVLDRMRFGWKNQVGSPWQTTWEGLSGGSKVHVYGIVPGYFLSAYVLGIRRNGPVGDRLVLVEPRPGDLANARGVVVTEFGPMPISWTKSASESMSLSVTVPENTTAKVRFRQRDRESVLLVDDRAREAVIESPYLAVSLSAGVHSVKHPD